MKNVQRLALIVLTILVLLLAACSSESDTAAEDTGEGDVAATEAAPEPVELNVDMVEFAFNPTTETVPSGAEVTVNLTNSGAIVHSYYVMEEGYTAEAPWDEEDEAHVLFEAQVEPGATGTLTFTAPAPGTYEVICAEPGHLEAGMAGQLIVE